MSVQVYAQVHIKQQKTTTKNNNKKQLQHWIPYFFLYTRSYVSNKINLIVLIHLFYMSSVHRTKTKETLVLHFRFTCVWNPSQYQM